ncbi:TonB-dependent receptor [Olivibacter sp. SDN3]|uniref:TonB-dependent receptor n=1 Tax=Olivibacter sp. SDN3 TaxID=2764720 RepID=UPI00165192C6|nr:TonB-dependent receptor [Olivibacter sp. SDN3]QNL50974.1 TonB-dependent receptor [Olivibacter sp. SDN3]
MKSTILILISATLILIHFNSAGLAQTKLEGVVKSLKGTPIPFASVRIKSFKGSAQTDSTGYFSISSVASDSVTLVISSVNYNTLTQSVTVTDTTPFLSFILQPKVQALNEVTVSAGIFAATDDAKGASLSPMEAVTVAGSFADISQALRALPGAQQIGEQEGLFVRGGTGDETKQFIDGTLNILPNYPSVPGITQYARINPFLFKGILFSSGGYSALYGQAMSSALILESVDLPDESSASLHVFPSSMGVGIQRLAKNERSSFGATLDYSNLKWYNKVIPQEPDYFNGPRYVLGDANFRIKIGKTGMLKFYTNWNKSNVGLYRPDIDSSSLRLGNEVNGYNWYNNLSFKSSLSDSWKLAVGASYNYSDIYRGNRLIDRTENAVYIDGEPFPDKHSDQRIHSHFFQPRLVLKHQFSSLISLSFGAEHFHTQDEGYIRDTSVAWNNQLTAAFAEFDMTLAKNLAVKAGGRLEHSTRLDQTAIAPRLSLAYRLNDGGQLNAAYGIFYQEPLSEFLYADAPLDFAKASHYILNYTKSANNRMLRIEAYYKRYQALVKQRPQLNSSGRGYARGMELFFRDKRTFKNLDYWVTYTFLNTKRDFMDYPHLIQPTFAAPHTATVAIKKFFTALSTNVNLSYSLAAGRPYYDIRSVETGYHTAIYDQGRTKPYNVMNIHIAYLTSFFKKWKRKDFSGIAFGVNNLLGTAQIFGYNYSFDGQNKEAITLPAPRTVFLGVFMSFGINRTDNFLDNL